MAPGSKSPQQARSRETMERLLGAAIDLLEEGGLAAVTVPDLAARAGVSTGSVYRRFSDKDDLLRAAFLRLLEGAHDVNVAALAPDPLSGLSLDAALRAVARGLVAQYRGRTKLLRALDQYLETQGDEAFSKRAIDLIEASLNLIIGALLQFRTAIRSADPERSIRFALLSGMTIIDAHKLHSPMLWRRMLPMDDETLAEETARLMASYLG